MSPAQSTATRVAARLTVASLPYQGTTPGERAARDAARYADLDTLPATEKMRPRYDRRMTARRPRNAR